MKLKPAMAAPLFEAKEVNGRPIRLSDYRGKKVLLTFYRGVGCPICNLRFHEIQRNASFFRSQGIEILAVYESPADLLKEYIAKETFEATLIPNPDLSLYNLYQVERSGTKVLKGLLKGAADKVKEGKKLFNQKIKMDGNYDRIGADFLLDENGKLLLAYYGQYVGDHLPIHSIKQLLVQQEPAVL
jgi:peroxiredoxin